MEFKEYFFNKKITLMGLGLLGRGIGDAKFLSDQGANLTVTDLKSEKELEGPLKELKGKNIKFTLGEHKYEDFENKDLIIKSAGVPLNSPYIKYAEDRNIPITISTALFAKMYSGMIIGITGTRGKSTVTHLLHHILESSGQKVFLGGNVKGVSTLAHLPNSTEDEVSVLELDSWQLQGFGYENISPHISIFTNFMSDHMNYYKGDMDMYFQDKANIFKYQNEEDILITTPSVIELIEKKNIDIKSKVIEITKDAILEDVNIPLPGEHNVLNYALAISASKQLGVSNEEVKKAVSNFSGVSGRLEKIKEKNNILFYNDTTSTTPDALIAGLVALGSEKRKNIILIMGGSDKDLDISEVPDNLEKFCKKVILLPGTGSDRLKNLYDFIEVENMSEAVKGGYDISREGDIVLLSPAFASFGLFKNEFERGEKFTEEVRKLGE